MLSVKDRALHDKVQNLRLTQYTERGANTGFVDIKNTDPVGPSCNPYEIVIGAVTTKMALCLPCSVFMVAQGYFPTSIHLGRGKSRAPLYPPYSPGGEAEGNELTVIRDLNYSWRGQCAEWVALRDVYKRQAVAP